MKTRNVFIVVALVAAFLILVMQVRVGDKDEQIGDLRSEVSTVTLERNELVESGKASRQELDAYWDKYEDLQELQRVSVEWGACLETWGTMLTQNDPGAKVQKTKCDTYLVEMKQLSEGDV